MFTPAPKYIHQIKIAPGKQVDIVKKGAPTPAGPCCTVGSVADEITSAVENIANAGGMGKHIPLLSTNDGKLHVMIDGGLSSNPGMGAVTGFSIFAAVATLKASIETIREQNSRINNAKKVLEDIQIHQECRKEFGTFLKDKGVNVIQTDGTIDFKALQELITKNASNQSILDKKINNTPYSNIEKNKKEYIAARSLGNLHKWSEKYFSSKAQIREDFEKVAEKTMGETVGLKSNELAQLYGKSEKKIKEYINTGIKQHNDKNKGTDDEISDSEEKNYTEFIIETLSQKPRPIKTEDWTKTIVDLFINLKNNKNQQSPEKNKITEEHIKKISKESPSKIRLAIRKEKWINEYFYEPLQSLLPADTEEKKASIQQFFKEVIESTKKTEGIYESTEEKSMKKFLKDGIIESRAEKIIPGYLASAGISLIALGRFVPLATPLGQFIMSAYSAGNLKMSYRDFKYAKSNQKLAKDLLDKVIGDEGNGDERVALNEAKKHYGSMKKWAAVSSAAWALNTAGMLTMGTLNTIKWAVALAAAPISAGLSISAAALTDTVSSLMTEGMLTATAAVASAALVCVPGNLKLRSRNFMSLKPPKSWEKENRNYVAEPFTKKQLEDKINQNKELREKTKKYRKDVLNSIELHGSKIRAKLFTKSESTLNSIMMWGGLGLFSNYVMKRKFKAKQRVSSFANIENKIEYQLKNLKEINEIFRKNNNEKFIGMENYESIFNDDELNLMDDIEITPTETTKKTTLSALFSTENRVKKEQAIEIIKAIESLNTQGEDKETLKNIIQIIEEHFGISTTDPKTPEGYLSTIRNHAKVGDIAKILAKTISETKNGKTRLRSNFTKAFGTTSSDKTLIEKLEELNQFGPCCDTTTQGQGLLKHLQGMFTHTEAQKALQKLLFNATNQYLVYQLNKELKEEKATWLDLYMNTRRTLEKEKQASQENIAEASLGNSATQANH